ncbi:hypothetical protein [Streptomyces sioyaensis]|uniref:hypothetical protein n=1 Tax=Streptomyces sioyaensis TaxID=67364 RepID=UPI00378A0811
MNDIPGRPAIQELRDALSGAASFGVHPLDIEDACRHHTEDGTTSPPSSGTF